MKVAGKKIKLTENTGDEITAGCSAATDVVDDIYSQQLNEE